MKKSLLLFLGLMVAGVVAHAQAKPLTPEEVEAEYRKDKLSGTLTPWAKAEVKLFRKDCESQLKDQVNDVKRFCACAQEAVAQNLNYSTFSDNSNYQKGRILGFLSKEHCFKK